ncbi:bacterial Ig-like domain-containing protein [Apilactobacillus ozensis]|uniref:bacterial Ig-like domain-containing protein n=1 Tax=Apilactobacillus ozensis TaxID=866801 RepID=UPI0006D1F6EA|nr:bacterial Ig-like domain-containing protein [Apilactobacillus ozensis]
MNWNAADNFINATNMYGDPVDLSKISINGNVDNKPGVYNISYNYINAAGENVQKTINVKVLMSKANLNLKNTIITQGSTFNKNDNIIDVYDMYGKKN